jgi:exopolysaccharide biosynthesis polyprenyl glycosylphosphotransferase
MLKEQAKLVTHLTVVTDAALVVLSFFISFYLCENYFADLLGGINQYVWVLLPALPLWYYLMAKNKLYMSIRQTSVWELTFRILSVHIIGGFFVSAIVLFISRDFYSRKLLLIFFLSSFILVLLERVCLKAILGKIRQLGFNYRQLIIVGATDRAEKFINIVEEHADWGLKVLGVIQVASGKLKKSVGNYEVFGRLDNLVESCKVHHVDEVVFCLAKDQVVDVEKYLQELEELGVTVRMVLDFYNFDLYKKDLSFFNHSLPILTFHTKSLDSQQYFLKRVLDICGAVVGLVLMLLLLPFIALAIKLDSAGPVFFCQYRLGENSRQFKIWKFRTMVSNAEEIKESLDDRNEMNGAIFKIKDDPRITRVGRILRKTSLDELPQFWNVLIGHMSLVGTRPPTPDEVEKYENWHRRRISIKPGITGLWQVSGRNKVEDFDEVVRLDLHYIDNWTLGLDLRILLRTLWVVLTRKGSC